MEIVEGVHLHFIKTDKFKTNRLTCRFSGDLTKVNRSRRALVAQMLATANASYPTSRLFRRRLAELYGAQLSTSIQTKGLVHMIDIDISFVANPFALAGEDLVAEVFAFLWDMLENPLRTVEQYQTATFDVEQANLVNYLEADKEDSFYYSDLELNKLYFTNGHLAGSKYGTPEQVAKENSYTAFQEFQRLMREDRIDLFLVGDIDEYKVLQNIHQFRVLPRQVSLRHHYRQAFSRVIQEKLDSRPTNQSVLNLAYHVPVAYGDQAYLTLLVVNGLLGLFPHSLLFSEIREKAGLAYTISSQFDPFQSVVKVQAGIDRRQRQQTLQLITKQLNRLKLGRFPSDLLRKTQKMLVNGAELTQDSHKGLIEASYNKSVFGELVLSLDEFRSGIMAVSKKEVVRLAQEIRLQAIYFMEGEDQ